MATKEIGSKLGEAFGWAKVSVITQPSGESVSVYRGSITYLDKAIAYIKSANGPLYDSMDIDSDEESGTATITLNKSATTTDGKPDDGQTRNPTVSIQGTMLSPQLHQHPTFSEGDNKLTLSAIATTDYCLKNNGEVITSDLNGENPLAIIYARWRAYGIDTYLAPSYTMSITYYLESTDKAKEFILAAGMVCTFDTACAKLPNALKPEYLDIPAWLAQAPSINITDDGVTVTQAFIGAKAFPSFYETEDTKLVYDPPELSDEYWKKNKNANSGVEESTEG